MILLDDFPSEILLKIFNYIPDRKAVALVNRRFYDVVCSLDESEMCLEVFSRFFERDPDGFLQSILNTTRTIRKITISFLAVKQPSIVLDILKKFGETIQYMRVCADDESDVIDAIALVPNVTHLEVALVPDFGQSPAKRARRCDCVENHELNLLRLKKLTIDRANRDTFLVMFNRLPADVLVELTLHCTSLPLLAELLRNQRKMKKLTIVSSAFQKQPIIGPDLFDNLKLEHLECHPDLFEPDTNRSMLAKQTNLTTLELIDGDICVDLLNAITDNLSKLEKFSISVSSIPVAAIKGINKLVNLKEIAIKADNEEEDILQINEFATLDNCRIETLNIQHEYIISDVSINTMAKSMPNLKVVSFFCDSNIRTFYAILKAFNYVEVLHLDTLGILFDKVTDNSATLMRNGCHNPKLTELRILYPMHYSFKYVQKMVADYPHLKKLIIVPTNKYFDKHFETILKGFKEIESFSILKADLCKCERYHNLSVAVEHGQNLKFLALSDMVGYEENQLNWPVNAILREKFAIVKYSQFGGLKMAFDRRTMKLETESIARYSLRFSLDNYRPIQGHQ